jgi:hypothetical protein
MRNSIKSFFRPAGPLSAAILAASILAVTLTSCTTIGSSSFLVTETTAQEKAQFLFTQGKIRFQTEILENNNLAMLPKVRQFFTEALSLDPLHPEAQKWIDDIDAFRQKKINSYKAAAQKLAAAEKRSAAQNFELVYDVKLASDLAVNDRDVQKLYASTQKVRESVIAGKEKDLAAAIAKLDAEQNQQGATKQIRDASKIVADLEKIDPTNKLADESAKKIDAKVVAFAQKDMDAANKALAAKKYADAEAAILRVEKTFAAVAQKPDASVTALKYKIYFGWASSLYDAKKYQSATARVAMAIKTNRTTEAVALKTKIDKAASNHDFDADIADILAAVDDRIDGGDPAGALNLIGDNLAKLKIQENKDKLSAKKDAVRARLKEIYQDAIGLYNEEDYEGARQKFRIVIAADAGYEQAQAYLDRTETKIKALAGND